MICMKCGKEMGDTAAHTCALVTTYSPTPERRPWRCPVCNGNGKEPGTSLPGTVYESKKIEPCHACNGIGIVWG
jgi:hypothetical protein